MGVAKMTTFYQILKNANLVTERVRCTSTTRERRIADTHTHIHNYSDFLVVTISVGLAQARPNYTRVSILTCIGTIIPRTNAYLE